MGRVMIAAPSSGSGKTTVTCAVLAALSSIGKQVISFKCGPDYIDPLFHRKVTHIPSRNLDVFLMGEQSISLCVAHHAKIADIAIIEGVMGFYDGISNTTVSSSNHISQLTETPVILVVNTKGKALSICAEIKGFTEFAPNKIKGVILNNASEKLFGYYKKMIEEHTGLEVIGFLPSMPQVRFESRHLGLITADEISNIKSKINILSESARQFINLDRLQQIAQSAPCISSEGKYLPERKIIEDVNIYVSQDTAFCFYYEDNIEILKALGANIRTFSPMHDSEIPSDADGIILWGGYPEIHAASLCCNTSMRKSIKNHAEKGVPVYAECGGFMYLMSSLIDSDNIEHEMCGILNGNSIMTDSLQNFGYAELTANAKTLLCGQGDVFKVHSFHHSKSTDEGNCFNAVKPSNGAEYSCIISEKNIFAGYPHFHFSGSPALAENFVKACANYRKEVRNGIHP